MTALEGQTSMLGPEAGADSFREARMPDPSRYRGVRVIALLGTIPLILAVAPLIGYGFGLLLDRWLHTGSVLRLVFLGLGFVAGVREMVQLIRRAQRDIDEL